MTDLETAKRRDSSTIRDDESANVSSSGAPLESGYAGVNTLNLETSQVLIKGGGLSKRENNLNCLEQNDFGLSLFIRISSVNVYREKSLVSIITSHAYTLPKILRLVTRC